MELKERIKLYLETRNQPVSRDELLRVGTATGLDRNTIYKITGDLQDMTDYDDCDVGTWWGYKDPVHELAARVAHEPKTLWLQFYKMTTEDKARCVKMFEDFDKST